MIDNHEITVTLTYVCVLHIIGIHVCRQTCISLHVLCLSIIHILDIHLYVYIHMCMDAYPYEFMYRSMYVCRHT